MWKKPPQEAEAWFSDISYNLNPQFNGKMGCDLPWGVLWSNGIGRSFFYAHHLIYKVFGAGAFQARLLNLFGAAIFLILFYKWVSGFYNIRTALAATLLLAASPSMWGFIANGRQDLLHCLFSFLAFFLITKAITQKRYSLYILAGFISFFSLEIDFRGIEIILCSMLFLAIMRKRVAKFNNLALFILGSSIAVLIWGYLNILKPGIGNFIKYNLASSLSETRSYTIASFLTEPARVLKYLDFGIFAAKAELLYLSLLLIVFFKGGGRMRDSSKYVLYWLGLSFVVISFFERTSYPSHILMYSPYLCILAGAGAELLLQKRKGFGLLVCIAALCILAQAARSGQYIYHEYIKKDYSYQVYADKLRKAVEPNKALIGDVTNWYIFKDDQYYGGSFYLIHLQYLFNDPPLPSKYISEKDRAGAILEFLKRKNIAYIIDCNNVKPFISDYFKGHILPVKNFKLVESVEDYYLGGDSMMSRPMRTDVYKIISYEP